METRCVRFDQGAVAVARKKSASDGRRRRAYRVGDVGGGIVEPGARPLNPHHPLYRPGGGEPLTVALVALGRFVLRVQGLDQAEVRPGEYEGGHHEEAVAHFDEP